jgi:hypothetical protein
MDEPRRDEQIGVKLTSVEKAEIGQAAAYAGMELAPWARHELLNAARGERATKNVEVPLGDLTELQAAVQRQTKVLLAMFSELLEHVHHGDPQSEHEDPKARALGRKRGERKMAKIMTDLGLNGSGKP